MATGIAAIALVLVATVAGVATQDRGPGDASTRGEGSPPRTENQLRSSSPSGLRPAEQPPVPLVTRSIGDRSATNASPGALNDPPAPSRAADSSAPVVPSLEIPKPSAEDADVRVASGGSRARSIRLSDASDNKETGNPAAALSQPAQATSPATDEQIDRDRSRSIPLAPPSRRNGKSSSSAPSAVGEKSKMIYSTIGSLLVVLAAFFVLVWFVKRSRPKGNQAVPSEAIERLGQLPMDNKRQFQLIRFGNKILLLAVSNTTTESLGEITDPDEVDRLTELCARRKSGSISESFRQVLAQIGNEQHVPGFLGSESVEGGQRRQRTRGRARGATYEA